MMHREYDLIRFAMAAAILIFLLPTAMPTCCVAAETDSEARQFEFKYGATIKDQEPGSEVKVWVPVPVENPFQQVKLTGADVPGVLHINKGHQFGNRIGYFEATVPESGSLSFELNYSVKRLEAKAVESTIDESTRQKFLQRNRLVPVSGKPIELIEGQDLATESLKRGQQLYEVVEQYMAYDKSNPGYGNGDVLWACSSKTGNCTDFHSLFISLARSQNLPAKFEIGFPIPSDKSSGTVAGYHCWAWFHAKDIGWVPVDISEADKHPDMKKYYFGRLTPHRIAFSIGRDIELFPQAASPKLNYFVYPHVEVAGKLVDKEEIQLDFRYQDSATAAK